MAKPDSEENSLGLSAVVVAGGTLFSRIFGLLRDVTIAYVFGASRVADVFFLAYRIPSSFRRLLAEGALSSSLVPVYTDVRNDKGEAAAHELGRAVFTWTLLLVGLVVVAGMLFADVVLWGLRAGADSLDMTLHGLEFMGLAVSMTQVMFPFLLMMSAAAVVMGILHTRKVYGPSAFAPVCLNFALIAAALWLAPQLGEDPKQQVWALAIGVLVGGFFQFFVQWWWLHRNGLTLGWNPDWRLPGLRRILRMMGPMAFGLAFSQLIVLTDTVIAFGLDAGNVSHIYYSNRLFQFPFALIGLAVGTVVLPESSDLVSRDDMAEVERTTSESLGLMSFLMVPSMVGLWYVGQPLIRLLFRGDEFLAVDQRITFGVLAMALFGLVAYGCIRIFVSVCYSFEDTIGPVWAATVAFLVNLTLGITLVLTWVWQPEFRVMGLAVAGSVAVWLQVFVLRWRLSRHLPGRSLVPLMTMFRHGVMAAGMALALGPFLFFDWSAWLDVSSRVPVGVAVYFGLAYWWDDPHLMTVIDELRGRLRLER